MLQANNNNSETFRGEHLKKLFTFLMVKLVNKIQ